MRQRPTTPGGVGLAARGRGSGGARGPGGLELAELQRNQLFDEMSIEALRRLRADLALVDLPRATVIWSPGETPGSVLFPLEGLASIVGQDESGTGVDVAIIGRDGVLGAQAALASMALPMETTQLIPGRAARMTTNGFLRAMDREPSLRRVVRRYLTMLFVATAQGSACNRLHELRARVARWLLLSRDQAAVDDLPFTQELLARMAGASRPKVSQAINVLVSRGAIETRRGWIRVSDEQNLESAACACYGIIRDARTRPSGA